MCMTIAMAMTMTMCGSRYSVHDVRSMHQVFSTVLVPVVSAPTPQRPGPTAVGAARWWPNPLGH